MTREISRKAAVSDISETRKWCLALGFDVFGFIYIYICIYIRYACGASLFEKVGKMLRWEILIQRFKGCSFATVINARFKLRVVGCRFAGLRNKYFLPPSLFFERAESSVSFENGICGPSGWRYVEKVENEVCQTPHFYTFFFRIYPKNIRISTWLFLLLETRPSRLNFWSNASQTGATERWVSILRVGLCWEWIIRSFESNKEFASPTFANLSPSLLFRERLVIPNFYFWNYYRKTRILVSPQCLSLGKKLSKRNVSISCRIHEFIVFSIFISSAWIMFPLDPYSTRHDQH